MRKFGAGGEVGGGGGVSDWWRFGHFFIDGGSNTPNRP